MAEKLNTDYTFDYEVKALKGWHPAIEKSLELINDNCLELNTHFLNKITASISMLSWLCLPWSVVALIYIYLPDLINQMGISFWSELELVLAGKGSIDNLIDDLLIILIGGLPLITCIIFVYVRRRNSTLLFNRKTQTVHAMIAGKHYFSHWKDMQLQFVTIKSWNGTNFMFNDGIRFYLQNEKNPDKVKKLEVEGSGPVEDSVSNRLLNWDFIRVFMDQSNDRSTLSFPGTGMMYFNERTKPYLTPKETFRQYWPFPYEKPELDFGNENLRLYNFVTKLLFFPLTIQSSLVWYGLMKILPGEMKGFPTEAREGCTGKMYSVGDIIQGKTPSFVNPDIPRVPESAGKPVNWEKTK